MMGKRSDQNSLLFGYVSLCIALGWNFWRLASDCATCAKCIVLVVGTDMAAGISPVSVATSQSAEAPSFF